MVYLLTLMFVVLGAMSALVISVVVGVVRRRWYWRLWLILGGIGLVSGVLTADGFSAPLFDDEPYHGPYQGTATEYPAGRNPDQVFTFKLGRLESFDAPKGAAAPIVAFKDTHGQLEWCILASGQGRHPIQSVRFKEASGWGWMTLAEGIVGWSTGSAERTERTTWRLWWNGLLRGYGGTGLVSPPLTDDSVGPPPLDDGPFHGTAAEFPAGRKPDQVFTFGLGVLESYDALVDEAAPIVAFKDSHGQLKWCIFATTVERERIQSVRFKKASGFAWMTVVEGIVTWRGSTSSSWSPAETTTWCLWWNGSLRGYFNSW